MGNEVEVKQDTTSQGQVNAENNAALIANQNGAARATSIIPTKGSLEPLRPTKSTISTEEIHIVHIIFFIGALYFLFSAMWKFGKKTKF